MTNSLLNIPRVMFLLLSVFTFLMLNNCATTLSQSAARVRDIDMKMPNNCQFLGDVRGSSLWGGSLGSSLGIDNAKNEAREKAASMGATHIFWNSTVCGNVYVSGNAFLCK